MNSYLEVRDDRSVEWDELASHPMQSYAWGEFRKKRQNISRLARISDGKIVRVWLVVWTKIPLVNKYFGYIPMGNACDENDLKELLKLGKRNKAVGIRMEPDVLINDKKIFDGLNLCKGRNLFKQKTLVWNLKLTEEKLLANMHPKARYNIRVAEKHGVIFQEDNTAINKYVDLLFDGTVKRQKVGMHNKDYQHTMFNTLNELGVAKMFTSSYQDKILSVVIIYIWKNSIYYAYGANSLENKEVMAATKLIWEVARWAKNAGYEFFDLWGTEEGKGFGRFKEQFGAEIVSRVGSFDLAINKIEYLLFRIIEESRWKIRHK